MDKIYNCMQWLLYDSHYEFQLKKFEIYKNVQKN